jgi:mono/diheme cytochrome c family protein
MLLASACAVAVATLGAVALAGAQGPAASGAAMKNPVAANASSIAAGKKLYDTQCASCHGPTGKGDGKGGALLKPTPADFTDEEWKHGATDGDLFTTIRDGVKQTGMAAYGSRIPARDIWNLVNYLRTLGPTPPRSH